VTPCGAGVAARRIEQLCQAPGEVRMVVRVVDDETLLQRMQQLADAVVARRDDW
jgi:hypothetical protein